MIALPYFAPYTSKYPHTVSILRELAEQSSHMSASQRICAGIISSCAVAVIGLLVIGFHAHCSVSVVVLTLSVIILCALLFFLYATRLVEKKIHN